MAIGNFVHLEVSVYNNNLGGERPESVAQGRSEQRRIWRVCRREKPARKFIHVKVHKLTLVLETNFHGHLRKDGTKMDLESLLEREASCRQSKKIHS